MLHASKQGVRAAAQDQERESLHGVCSRAHRALFSSQKNVSIKTKKQNQTASSAVADLVGQLQCLVRQTQPSRTARIEQPRMKRPAGAPNPRNR